MKKNAKQLVREVCGTMALEKMDLKENEKTMLLKCAKKEVSYHKAVDDLVKKYSQK